jgi:hypothetical protein
MYMNFKGGGGKKKKTFDFCIYWIFNCLSSEWMYHGKLSFDIQSFGWHESMFVEGEGERG